jgi:hypothetical protein
MSQNSPKADPPIKLDWKSPLAAEAAEIAIELLDGCGSSDAAYSLALDGAVIGWLTAPTAGLTGGEANGLRIFDKLSYLVALLTEGTWVAATMSDQGTERPQGTAISELKEMWRTKFPAPPTAH